jgi:hypothetical protein
MFSQRETSMEDENSNMSTQFQGLSLALNDLLFLKLRSSPKPMQLENHFQFPLFSWKMNGEIVDSWICNLSTYFKTSHEMEEDMKLHITSLIHGYATSTPISKPLMTWKRTLSYISLACNLKALSKPRGTHNWKPLNW